MATFTKVYHNDVYPAIDPRNPLNSQSGRTVMVTGSTSGIGFAAAEAFVKASAARVVILSRQQPTLDAAVSKLKISSSSTEIVGRIVDISDESSIKSLWSGLKKDGIDIDVLILNAAQTGNAPLLSEGVARTWKYFETNVLAGLRMIEKFTSQGPKTGKVGIIVF